MALITKNKSFIKKEIDKLPPQLIQEVLDFIRFLRQKEEAKTWIEFDEWALNLAKEKGFSNLSEKEIANIVESFRKSR